MRLGNVRSPGIAFLLVGRPPTILFGRTHPSPAAQIGVSPTTASPDPPSMDCVSFENLQQAQADVSAEVA
jgi:hypothetical protein